MVLPAPSFALTVKRSTSPVRASTLAGDNDSDASAPAATTTGIFALAVPTDAVIVAFPARTAATNPASVTVATAGSELFQATRSARLSLAAENTRPVARRR